MLVTGSLRIGQQKTSSNCRCREVSSFPEWRGHLSRNALDAEDPWGVGADQPEPGYHHDLLRISAIRTRFENEDICYRHGGQQTPESGYG